LARSGSVVMYPCEHSKSLKSHYTLAYRCPIMKCSAVRAFLSQINYLEDPFTSIPSADLDYLSVNGYVLRTTKEDYDKGFDDVARLSQIITQVKTEKAEEEQTD